MDTWLPRDRLLFWHKVQVKCLMNVQFNRPRSPTTKPKYDGPIFSTDFQNGPNWDCGRKKCRFSFLQSHMGLQKRKVPYFPPAVPTGTAGEKYAIFRFCSPMWDHLQNSPKTLLQSQLGLQ